jgi:hypothetical protein
MLVVPGRDEGCLLCASGRTDFLRSRMFRAKKPGPAPGRTPSRSRLLDVLMSLLMAETQDGRAAYQVVWP